MKDFDTERLARKPSEEQRTFKLGGETFTIKTGLHPDVLERYDAITPEMGVTETMAIVDELIVNMIESKGDSAARYASIRSNQEDPITVEDLQALVQWAIEKMSGQGGENPTGAPDDSSSGPLRIVPPSTASSSPQDESVAPSP